MIRHFPIWAMLGAFTLSCGGQSDDGNGGAGNGNGNGDSVVDRTFLFDSAEGFTPITGTTPRVSFTAGDISFNAGCNSHSGLYELEGGRLIVENLGSTLIGCEAALHEQDEWLAEFFTSSPLLNLAGDQLTLEGSAATLVFLDREVADPDRMLTARWTIDTLIDGPVATGGIPGEPTVSFDARGCVVVFSSCNTASGRYTASDTELELTNMAYTEEGCNDADLMAVEQHVQQVLTDGNLIYAIDAARLTLTRGELGLMATTE